MKFTLFEAYSDGYDHWIDVCAIEWYPHFDGALLFIMIERRDWGWSFQFDALYLRQLIRRVRRWRESHAD